MLENQGHTERELVVLGELLLCGSLATSNNTSESSLKHYGP